MDSRKQILSDFYANCCNEDNRLIGDKHSQIEFITTTKYIDKYLMPGDKILEIGAGTGRYSIFYAQKGFCVNAIELVEHNLQIMKSKITPDLNITAEQGDALDLSRFADDTFDVCLVLGPLYHLYNQQDMVQAINEAIRVTKKHGIIFLAYLTSDSIMLDWAIDGHLIDGQNVDFDKNFKMINYPEGLFAAFYIKEFKKLMTNFNVKALKNITTDGVSHHIKDKINKLNDDEFNVWLKYHLSTCERFDLQGYGNHMLYICQKL